MDVKLVVFLEERSEVRSRLEAGIEHLDSVGQIDGDRREEAA